MSALGSQASSANVAGKISSRRRRRSRKGMGATSLDRRDKENLFNLAAALGCDRLVLAGVAAAGHVDYDSTASSDWSFACLYLVVAESSSPQIDIHPFVKPGHEQDGVHKLHRHVAVEAPDEADADDDSNSS
ncbi:hypothetical protein ACQJBY_048585 [Aegilops geniculata]